MDPDEPGKDGRTAWRGKWRAGGGMSKEPNGGLPVPQDREGPTARTVPCGPGPARNLPPGPPATLPIPDGRRHGDPRRHPESPTRQGSVGGRAGGIAAPAPAEPAGSAFGAPAPHGTRSPRSDRSSPCLSRPEHPETGSAVSLRPPVPADPAALRAVSLPYDPSSARCGHQRWGLRGFVTGSRPDPNGRSLRFRDRCRDRDLTSPRQIDTKAEIGFAPSFPLSSIRGTNDG